MKKGVVIGCSAVLLLVVVAGAFAWFKVIAPAFKAGSELVGIARQIEQYQALNGDIRNQSPYSAPADGTLSPPQVEAVLAVQRHIRDGMAHRLKELEQHYKALEAEFESGGRQPGIEDLARAYSDLFGLIVDAKRLQVEALNRQGLSMAEYHWARVATLHAAGISISGVLQLEGDIAAQVRARHQVPEGNVALVEPHAKELIETAVLAAMGL
ncbi:MAG TPA: hypothetical protein PKZ76_11080 [Xanthomonadaceae bacterium]|nr:hypothetical protein [Xanthomonadaceae bacterium]